MICLSELASNEQEKKARWRVEGLVSPVPGGLSLPSANWRLLLEISQHQAISKTIKAEGYFVFTYNGF